ncbi:hypothetical protein GQ54DRAFT_299318 [Martensiomyces pterosporus]|nr:hypothetical protein GQ54DRAFT_299318 [Martensiomyces pterosporus]
MKLSLAIGILGALAQVSVAKKCHRPRPHSSYATSAVVVPTLPAPATTPAATYTTAPVAVSSASSVVPATTSVVVPTSSAPYVSSSAAAPSPTTTSPATTAPAQSSPATSAYATSPATPTSPPSSAHKVTLDQLNKALPLRAADNSCTQFLDECVTNSKAVVAINNAIAKYGITRRGEAVAVISLIAFESGTWQYNTNHFPGRPGQGTRNMMMYNFIEEYAKLLHPTEAAAAGAKGSSDSDATKNAVRALVLNDDDSFGSGFWYLVNKASAYHNGASKLRDGNADDFKDYITTGVGADWDEARLTVWNAVNSALTSF